MGFKLRIDNRIKFPRDFDFSDELKTIAKKVVIPLLKEGILTNTDVEGKRFPQLEYSTAVQKQKKYGHTRPLIADQELLNAFTYKQVSTNQVVVYIKEIRNKIAEILQIEGVGRRGKVFNFFGITEGMQADAMEIMENKLRKILNG